MRKFHTLLSKPVDLFISNSIVNFNIVYVIQEFISWCSLDLGLGWNLSIISTAALLRLGWVPLSTIIDKINWVSPNYLRYSFEKAQKTFLLNDLERDVKRFKLNEDQHTYLKNQLEFPVLARQSIEFYTFVLYFRALHHMCYTPYYYPGLVESSFWIWNLTSFDPLFVFPLAVGALCFLFMEKSFHSFTLPMKKYSKLVVSAFAAFGSLYSPIAYVEGFFGIVLTHLILKRRYRKVKFNN